jgi:hypothetical protein
VNIIGLGQAGCQLAKKFENYTQYKVFLIDNEDCGWGPATIRVPTQKTHEDYEKRSDNLKLKRMNNQPVILILAGSGKISGLSLRLLEKLKKKNTTVIYIKPNIQDMSKEAKLRHKVTFGILQQYARSNAIDHLRVIDNKKIEDILVNVSIKNYWNEINDVIFSTFHMLNVFQNTEPLLTTSLRPHTTAKISTMGVVNFDTFKEKIFYDLEAVRNKKYFFGVNKATLEEKKDLLQKIRGFVGEQVGKNTDVGFSIYSTDYEVNYIYSLHYTSFVQEQQINF